MIAKLIPLIALLSLVAGCSSPPPAFEIVPVNGTVKLKGTPLRGAVVTFTPIGETRGAPAFGRTDANGNYQLKGVRGENGVAEGEFKVTISKRVLPDGSDVPENDTTAPIDSNARELLPPTQSDIDQTKLTAKVAKGSGPIDFLLP